MTRILFKTDHLPDSYNAPSSDPFHLVVAIPALNEEKTVGDVIRRVPDDIPGIGKIEVLVVDDGSKDRTAEEATQAGARVIRHPFTGGVGSAFHTALTYSIEQNADLLMSIDADGQFNPADIPLLISPVIAGIGDFTTASRFKDSTLTPQMPRLKLWGNWLMSRLVSQLTGQTFFDVSCGMRCYSRRALLQLCVLAPFTYTQEVFLNLAFKRLRIVEVPIRVRGEREFGRSRVARSLWRYGLQTASIVFRAYRDYHPLRFFGGIAAVLVLFAIGLTTFLLIHYFQTGSFSPHKWAGFSAVALGALALIMGHLGMVGDMLNRQRIYLEELLYRQRSAMQNERQQERKND